jgi:hypothetical protein
LSTDGRLREFSEIGRLPAPGDNVAIATGTLEAGTEVERDGSRFTVEHTALEGHRFAVEPIAEGEELHSWGLPFGRATKDIAPGAYACNEKILRVLRERGVGFELPEEPNFRDAELVAYALDEEGLRPGSPVPLYGEPGTFMGYRRAGSRGVGTRNYVVIVGVTSRTGGFAKGLEWRLRDAADAYENVSGVVASRTRRAERRRCPTTWRSCCEP